MAASSEGGGAAARQAWREACQRFERLGERIFDADFPAATDDRVEGVAHVTQQIMSWLSWSVFHADPRRPAFQRQNDLITPWGGPNADNVYRHARVASGRTYRIRGRMHSCEEFILAVRAGFMGQQKWGTLHHLSGSDLGIGRGDEFDFLVGGDAEGAVPLPEGAATVSIREYYFDWRVDEPATFTIECLDDDAIAPRERLGDNELAARIEDAVTGAEHSIEYWNRYMVEHRAEGTDNEFAPPMKLAKGLSDARYRFCFWDLAEDEALVVESNVPDSRYWSFQLYNLAWFELVDPVDRQTSLSHEQVSIDGDGRVRVVVSHRDPGVANWLDAGGRRDGLLTIRWFWPGSSDPDPTTRVVKVGELASDLPPDTVRVDAAQRIAALQERRRHLAWRFRT